MAAKKHHFIPKSFLAAWSDDGTVDGRLFVLDRSSGRHWVSSPLNSGFETHLYRIDVVDTESPDLSESEIEDAFMNIESAAIPTFKRLLDGESGLLGLGRVNISLFLATLIMRVPARLKWIQRLLQLPANRAIELAAARDQERDPAIDALLDLNTKNAQLAMMLRAVRTLTQLLMARQWTVLRTDSDAGDLICTDMPVLLNWIKPVANGEQPGFGLVNTAVFVPIGPLTALVGLWDATPTNAFLTRTQVASWNAELLRAMDRFVFCRTDFFALQKSGQLHQREDVLKCWNGQS